MKVDTLTMNANELRKIAQKWDTRSADYDDDMFNAIRYMRSAILMNAESGKTSIRVVNGKYTMLKPCDVVNEIRKHFPGIEVIYNGNQSYDFMW